MRGLPIALMLLAGCYHHQERAAVAAPALRPALPGAQTQRFVLSKQGKVIGSERYTVTSTEERWTVEASRQLNGEAPSTERYQIALSELSGEPTAMQADLSFLGEAQRMRGKVAEGYLRASWSGFAGEGGRGVPYAPGTALMAAPVGLRVWVLALILPSLKAGGSVSVRTIWLDPPLLNPRVLLESYEDRGEKSGLRHILVRHGERYKLALWVDKTGCVRRARELSPALEITPAPTASP